MNYIVVADAGPLINFLALDRMDLFGLHPAEIVITDHVVAEITDSYPVQLLRLSSAIENGFLRTETIERLEIVELFVRLRSSGRLGAGECSSIAFSHFNSACILMDDRRAVKATKELSDKIPVVGSGDFLLELIACGKLSVGDADQILHAWATQHRFRLPFQSFADVLIDSK